MDGLFWRDALYLAELIEHVKRGLLDPGATGPLCSCMFDWFPDLTLNLDRALQQPHHERVLAAMATRLAPSQRGWRAAVWIKNGQLKHPRFNDLTGRTAARLAYALHAERHSPHAPDLTSDQLESMSIADLADLFGSAPASGLGRRSG